jgi:hypothetical protein
VEKRVIGFVSFFVAAGVPVIMAHPALAATDSVPQVQSFLESIIKIVTGLAGLVATGFFVIGGLRYITSSGDPRLLERAKRTILYSAVGLSITIAAFVISSVVTTLATNAFGS